MKVVLTTLNAKYIHSSLALRYLKTYCDKQFPAIVIKEYTINNTLLDILAEIYREKADVVGFACYIWNIEMTLSLVQLLKKVAPAVRIVLGGPEVSFDPTAIMQANPSVDFIICGEGEETLRLLLEALQGKQQGWQAICGLAYREAQPVFNGPPQVMTDLDSISFPYAAADVAALADKIIYYESSRGCPFMCQYCLSSATQGVRFFSIERVRRDLQVFIDYNVKQVKFVDRTFNAKKEHYLPIMKFLAAQDCSTNFHFEIAVDLMDEEVLDFLKQVPPGRFQFEIGIQSTHKPTLTAINRQNNWPKIVHNVNRISASGNIHLHLDLIIGLPYEDYERFGQSFNDVYALNPNMLQIGFLKMLKGSGIRQQVTTHQYIFMDAAPYEVLQNRYLPYAAVSRLKLFEDLFEQIYNSGLFHYTLPFVVSLRGGNAFRFYDEFTAFWEQHNLQAVAHSAKSLYQHFYNFCETFLDPDELAFCREFLKFDALAAVKGVLHPDFLDWSSHEWQKTTTAFWRDAQVAGKYVPGFQFHTWRQIQKNYHIEVFKVDIPRYRESGQLCERLTPVLFRYDQGLPQFTTIDVDDFPVGG